MVTSPVVQAFAAVCLGLVVAAAALGLTFAFAPELRPVIDDPTPDEVDPPPTMRERMIVIGEPGPEVDPAFWGVGAIVHSRPIGEPTVHLAYDDPADDGAAVKVGQTWVHRSCSNARRDSQPERVCAYCAPRLAGIPTAGGSK